MKVLSIIGQSQYDSTSRFMLEMTEHMRECGWQVDLLDGTDATSYREKRREVVKQTYDVIFTINGMLLEEDSSLGCELLKGEVLYCTYLMDHPLIHEKRLQNTYPKIFVLSPDRNHVAYTDSYLHNIWGTAFLPHGGCCGGKNKPYQERKIDISFMGSYVSPQKVWKEFQTYPSQMCFLLEETAKLLVQKSDWTLEQAVLYCLKQQGIKVSEQDFPKILGEFRVVDRYARSYFREKVICTLIEAGIQVDVYGDGWEKMKTDASDFLQVHPRVSYKDSLDIIGDSKISLNVMPWFKDGSHDRVFTSMLNGAICLTDGSGYLEEEFREGESIYFYSLKGLKYLPSKVKKILAQTEKSSQIAANGMRLAQTRHTWANRAEEVMDYLSQITDDDAKEVFSPNILLVKRLSEVIENLRRQDFLHGMRGLSAFLKSFQEILPLYIKWSDVFAGWGITCETESLLSLLQNILDAQERKEYILLADLLELQLLPFIVSIQEGFAANGFVEQKTEENYRMELTSSGAYTLAVQGASGWQYLHTNGNPYEEGMILAESWFDGEHYDYVVYGLGLGYHVQALLEIDDAVHVTVFESDEHILALAQEYGVVEEWQEDDRVKIVLDEDFQKLVELSSHMGEKSCFVIHYPSLMLIQDGAYRQQLEHYFIEYSSAQTQKNSLTGNFLRNRPLFQKEVTRLQDKFQGKTVYIIAAGPSLDNNMHELQKVGNEGIILATGTVLKKLLRAGIRPDYVMITDSGAGTYRQVVGMEETDIPLLYLSTVYYKIPAGYPGERYVIFQQGFEKSESYAAQHGYAVYETGGSVTTTALEISIRLGAKRIVFVGADMAYTGNRDHASDTASVREVLEDRGCMVTDIHGNQIPSAKNLNLYREWLERRILREKGSEIEFIDATEGGARIEGTLLMNLSTAICGNDISDKEKRRNLVVLIGETTQHEEHEYIIRRLSSAIEKKGYRTLPYIMPKKNPYSTVERLLDPLRNEICLVISIDAVCFEIFSLAGEPWINTLPCLWVTYLTKHPVALKYNWQKEWGWNVIVHTSNARAYDCLHDVVQMDCEMHLIPDVAWYTETVSEKIYPYYVPGEYVSLQSYEEQIDKFPDVFANMARRIRNVMLGNNEVSLEMALSKVCFQIGFALTKTETEAMLSQMFVIEQYVQMEKIQGMMLKLLESGEDVYVCGKSWNNFPYAGTNLLNLSEEMEGTAEKTVTNLSRSRRALFPYLNGKRWEENWLATAYSCGVSCICDVEETLQQSNVVSYIALKDYAEKLLHLEEGGSFDESQVLEASVRLD